MKKIKFSIIVPIYNVEQYLKQCIESIIGQSFKNIEIILVDDGSLDGCPKICDEYAEKDNRIKIIHKKNGGLVSARKIGAENALGEYIICVDGDDWLDLNYVKKFNETIEKYSPDVICCGAFLAYQNKNIRSENKLMNGLYERNDIIEKIFPILIERKDGMYFEPSVWAKAFKRKLYVDSQININNRIKIGEDSACVKPIIYNAERVYIMKECMYYYRQNETSMTKEKKAFDWEGPKLIGMHFEDNFIKNKSYDFRAQIDRYIVHNLFNVCISQFNTKEKYKFISKKIKQNIVDSYYRQVINRCKYSIFSKGWFALRIIKYKMIPLMWIYNKYQNVLGYRRV